MIFRILSIALFSTVAACGHSQSHECESDAGKVVHFTAEFEKVITFGAYQSIVLDYDRPSNSFQKLIYAGSGNHLLSSEHNQLLADKKAELDSLLDDLSLSSYASVYDKDGGPFGGEDGTNIKFVFVTKNQNTRISLETVDTSSVPESLVHFGFYIRDGSTF